VRLVTGTQAASAKDAARQLSEVKGRNIHPRTVRRTLQQAGLKAVNKKKKPLLKPHHRRGRLHFCQEYQHWTVRDWMRVIFSDEVKVNRLGSDGRAWGWKKPGEELPDRLVQDTLKYGGGHVMLWGCMTWEGVGFACKIDGNMDGQLYKEILEDELLQTLEYYGLEVGDIIFQQDNDPKHTSKKAKEFFEEHQMRVLKWPAQSPDLNPIEHLWVYIKRRLNEYPNPPEGILELWERIQVEWEKIPVDYCQKLISSMPRRIKAVLRAKGGHTKY
jgi:transposase